MHIFTYIQFLFNRHFITRIKNAKIGAVDFLYHYIQSKIIFPCYDNNVCQFVSYKARVINIDDKTAIIIFPK